MCQYLYLCYPLKPHISQLFTCQHESPLKIPLIIQEILSRALIVIAHLNEKLAKREEDTNTQNNSLEELKLDKQNRKSELDEARELANADIDVLNKLKNSIQSSYSIIENN